MFIKKENMILILVLFVFLIMLGSIENFFHLRNLRKIKYRILINGTRGKTTVSKIIIQALNNHGIRTIGRTTGSEACIINPDGSIKNFVRKKGARITEIIPFVRLCKKESVDCLVVECMALTPENQKIFSSKLVKPTHVVITNSYIDHICEIGEDKKTTMWALSNSVSKDSIIIATDAEYQELGNEFYLVNDLYQEVSELPVNRQSLNIGYTLLKLFGINKEYVLEAAKQITPDIGLHDKLIVGSSVLYPYFSINDLDTMSKSIKEIGEQGKVSLIFNNRADREYRIKTFEKALYENIEYVEKLYIIGDYPQKVKRYLSHWCRAEIIISNANEIISEINNSANAIFLGLGNIKGPGEAIVRYYTEENK